MKILISNDDGIFAPGIAALVRAFHGAGHQVFVCAPDEQRSAASHSLSIRRPMTARKTQLEGASRAYAISGTPADCVKLGLLKLCPEAEAVVSGINRGYNVGSDILYSGTVGAAMEGALCGRPALAVSQPGGREDYAQAAALAVEVFAEMMKDPLPPQTVLNLNYPDCDAPLGLVRARMEQLHYAETYAESVNEAGEKTYALSGVIDGSLAQSEDYRVLQKGYASLTVLRFDMTDHAATKALKMGG